MIRLNTRALSFLILLFLLPHYIWAAEFSRLVIFGDSLSDTGNIPISLPYPYYQGRISDGPVMVDFVAQGLGLSSRASEHLTSSIHKGFNYAVAGGNILGNDVEDLSRQVTAFLQRQNLQIDANTLFLVIMGGNDLRDIRGIRNESNARVQIQTVVNALKQQVQRLTNSGARQIVIAGVPNIGKIPETLQREQNDPGISARAQQYTQIHNQAVRKFIAKASNSVSRLHYFDFYQVAENIVNQASRYGFSNTEEGCFDPNNYRIETECLIYGFERRFFFDNLHLSSAAHRLLATPLLALIRNIRTSNTQTTIAPILYLLLESDD